MLLVVMLLGNIWKTILSGMPLLKSTQTIFIVLVGIAILKPASTEIVVAPKDAEAVVGANVVFQCSSSIPGADVQWNVYPVGKPMQVIYAYGKFNTPYADRFTVQNGHNLNISSINIDDAGTYECRDGYGKGEKQSAELIILESNPNCRSNTNLDKIVGKNTCGIEPGLVAISCSVQYVGNKPPTLEWKKNGDVKTITSGVSNEIRGNRILHNLTMKGDSIANGSSYNCRPAKAVSASATCNSGTITILATSDSCQSYTAAIVCILIIVNPILNAITASVIWYLYIRNPKQKKEKPAKSKSPVQETDSSGTKQKPKTGAEAGTKSNPSQDNSGANPDKSSKSPVQETDSSGSKQKTKIEAEAAAMSNPSQENSGAKPDQSTIQKTDSSASKKTKKNKAEAVSDQSKVKKSDSNQDNSGGSGLPCKFSTEAVIFVVLVCIPFCIGLIALAWYRRKQLIKEKEQSNMEESQALLLQKEEIDQKDEKIQDLEKKNWDLKNQINKLTKNSERQDDIINQPEEDAKAPEPHFYSREILEYVEKPVLIHTIGKDTDKSDRRTINGIGVLEKELFVLKSDTSDIEVYNSTTYKVTRKLKIPGMEGPFDLTTGKVDKCLFVIGFATKVKVDGTESLIGRLNAKGVLFDHWPKASGGHKGGISTCQSSVIVCLSDNNMIKEFSRDGELIHTVLLSPVSGFENPLHAVKVTSTQFVVSHGHKTEKLDRICVVDLKGNIIKECREWKNEKFSAPIHLIEDDERSLLVADAVHRQILLLNVGLKYHRKLIELSDKFKDKPIPARICFDETQRKLFVATNQKSESKGLKDGRVEIYDIKS